MSSSSRSSRPPRSGRILPDGAGKTGTVCAADAFVADTVAMGRLGSDKARYGPPRSRAAGNDALPAHTRGRNGISYVARLGHIYAGRQRRTDRRSPRTCRRWRPVTQTDSGPARPAASPAQQKGDWARSRADGQVWLTSRTRAARHGQTASRQEAGWLGAVGEDALPGSGEPVWVSSDALLTSSGPMA